MKARIGIVAVLAVAVVVSGAVLLIRTAPKTATVRQVTVDPGAYYGSVVRVTGTASMATPKVGGYRVFGLEDGSAIVLVLTRLGMPVERERIRVQGRVNAAVSAGPVDLGTYLVEEKRSSAGQ